MKALLDQYSMLVSASPLADFFLMVPFFTLTKIGLKFVFEFRNRKKLFE